MNFGWVVILTASQFVRSQFPRYLLSDSSGYHWFDSCKCFKLFFSSSFYSFPLLLSLFLFWPLINCIKTWERLNRSFFVELQDIPWVTRFRGRFRLTYFFSSDIVSVSALLKGYEIVEFVISLSRNSLSAFCSLIPSCPELIRGVLTIKHQFIHGSPRWVWQDLKPIFTIPQGLSVTEDIDVRPICTDTSTFVFDTVKSRSISWLQIRTIFFYCKCEVANPSATAVFYDNDRAGFWKKTTLARF